MSISDKPGEDVRDDPTSPLVLSKKKTASLSLEAFERLLQRTIVTLNPRGISFGVSLGIRAGALGENCKFSHARL